MSDRRQAGWDTCCWCAKPIDPNIPPHEPMAGYLKLAHTKDNHHRKCGEAMDQAFHDRAVREHLVTGREKNLDSFNTFPRRTRDE